MTTTRTPAARFVVCPDCEGTGTRDTLGSFTHADIDEWYGPDTDDFIDQYRAGMFTAPCLTCEGVRVITPKAARDWHLRARERAEEYAEARAFGHYR